MIDLEEAARSFASYTMQLDLLCLAYGVASDAAPQLAGIEPQIASPKDEVKDRLNQRYRESLEVSILVQQKLTEVLQLGAEPKGLTKFINASNRMVIASQKAFALLEDHEVKEKAKNAPPEENPNVRAIREFKAYRKTQDARQPDR